MSGLARPRGPLPARVYWFRRTLVLGVALALVWGVAQLLGGSGGRPGEPSASPVGAGISQSAGSSASADPGPRQSAGTETAGEGSTTKQRGKDGRRGGKKHGRKHGKKHPKASPTRTPLPDPTGPCANDDLRVEPAVKGTAYAGRTVTFQLTLSTTGAAACTWEVTPRSLVVKLTSGSDRIWSTQDCPGATPKQQVVVYRDHPVRVHLGWNGQRSDDSCSRTTAWALPGYYHVTAAALGADPVDRQFKLHQPTPRTITATPDPKQKQKQGSQT